MKRSLRISVVTLTLVAAAAAADPQQMSDPRVADLVRTGRIRVAVFPPQYTKNPTTGEIGGMQMDLARALAARLGIAVLPIEYPTPAEVVEGLEAGTCDVAFLVVDAVRAVAVDFSAPFAVRDFTYLVPADSSIRSAATADRRGVRIAVVRAHASTFALSHIVKQAELVQTESLDAALDLLRTGQVHLLASARQDLVRYSTPATRLSSARGPLWVKPSSNGDSKGPSRMARLYQRVR